MLRSRLVPAGAAALALSLLVAGCSSDDEPAKEKGSDKDTTAATAGGEWSVSGALAEVPDSAAPEQVFVQTGDLVAAIEAAGLERSDDSDPFDWLIPIAGVSQDDAPSKVFVPMPELLGSYARITEPRLQELVGIGLNDIDAFTNQATPPTDLTVLSGDGIGPDGLSDDLVEHDGVHSDVEGDDLAVDLAHRDETLSQLGRPTRIRAEDGAVALSSVTPAVKDWRGDADTLADRAPLAAVAAGLDEHDVYSAVLTEVETGVDLGSALLGKNYSPEQADAVLEQLEKYIPEASYDMVGIGWAVEDGEARVHVAYHFDSEDDAAAGLKTLESAWSEAPSQAGKPMSDFVSVEDAATDGSVATISLGVAEDAGPGIVMSFLQQREPVFVSR